MTSSKQVLNVLQITDCHLRAEADGTLLGMKTRDSLDAVLDLVRREPEPDLVLMTGDLAQDGSMAAYACLKERLAFLQCPIFWFMGNHDNAMAMRNVVGDGDELSGSWQGFGWHFVFLDSSSPGNVHGRLGAPELERLSEELSANPDKLIAIVLHHHPVPVHSRWLDQIGLKDCDAFMECLGRHPNVRLILWGHIHQEFDDRVGQTRLLASPSTCVQFKPGSVDFALDAVAPGFRRLALYPDGRIETEVVRAEGADLTVDMGSSGY